MMFFDIPRGLIVGCAASVLLSLGAAVDAREFWWQGDSGAAWNTASNWFAPPPAPPAGFVPQVTGSINGRAIIGTDNPNGALNSTIAPAVSPVISGDLPTPKDTIGGLYLGLRDRNLAMNPPPFTQPNAPAAGALVGALTISAGTLNAVSTSDAGADGRIVVGADGRGYLTMTGGVLTGTALVVAGENNSSGLGTSLLDMSGNASLTVTGAAQFSRRLRVVGEAVVLSAGSQIRLDASNNYTTIISHPTQHSTLTATNALSTATIGGTLNVEFTGAAASRDPIASLGTKWDLVRVNNTGDTAITGTFSNEGNGRSVNVTGLTQPIPLGAVYRLKQEVDGSNTELQLSYEQSLVLRVDRGTGDMWIRNPLGGDIAIDAYSVSSARGSMVTTYTGIGASTPNAGIWVKPSPPGGNNANALSEVKQPLGGTNEDDYDLSTVLEVPLGVGFSRTAVGLGGANFGFDGEDLIFEYGGPATGDALIRGQIEYVGTKFENDIVLRVDPNTGQAFIKNDTLVPRTIDGYSILSSTGNLIGASFSGGLGGSWQTSSPPTANAISQTNLTGSTTIPANGELAIGDISATGFLTDAAKNGLSLQFALATGGSAAGDYNNNGVVDAADFTIWRNALNTAVALPNQNPNAATPNLVDQEDYDFWKQNFGAVGGGETNFRVGSVVFDENAGAGGLTGTAVPEPTAGWLMLAGLSVLGFVRRNRRNVGKSEQAHQDFVQSGGRTMADVYKWPTTALFGICALLVASLPAAAVTQGIPLINGDFELPGPPGVKVIAFDDLGVPIPGIIPGWTFTGGSGDPATGEVNAGVANSLFGDGVPGDSGTEGGGSPGNELILSTLDGKVFQTSSSNLTGSPPFPNTQKLKLSFDAHNIFTPIGAAQLTARLYYVDTNQVKQTIGSPLVISNLGSVANYSLEFRGDVPADMALLAPAINRPLGVEFDTTSYESDMTAGRLESWAGVDDVILQITGIRRGDLNGDGQISNADYLILRDNLQEAHVYEFEGELTGDGIVDLNDFRAFKNAFLAGGSGSIDFSGIGVPEPSTMVLVLLMAIAARFFRQRQRSKSPISETLFVVAAVIAISSLSATESQAELLAYDPFRIGANPAAGEYIVTTSTGEPPVVSNPLAGQNPTIGPASPSFFSGEWITASPGQAVIATSIPSYRNTATLGGAVNGRSPTGGIGRSQRMLAAPWTDATEGTFYISAMVNFGTTTTNMGYRALEFFPPDEVPDENRVGDIGYNQFFSTFGAPQQNAATAKIQFNMNGNQQIVVPSPDSYLLDGQTHLLVLKFELSATDASDRISLYFDPTTKTEPSGPTNVLENQNWVLGAIGSASSDGDPLGTTVLDEIRVGTTYLDVVPPDLPLPGDTNKDDLVDMIDYQAIITHMNQPGARTLLEGDVTGDGRVTIADYRFWKERRTDIPGAGGGSVFGVPEPGALVLLLTGFAFAVLSPRRAIRL